MDVSELLTPEELRRVKSTLEHFLNNPDYAEGGETGRTFALLEFGDPFPVELVLRDWKASLRDGTGDREYRAGDCFDIYEKLFESNSMGDITFDIIMN